MNSFFAQITKESVNHNRYPRIIPQIEKSKTLKKLNQIKSDSINLHENIVVLQW
jgi:hypothetical protein